MQAVSSVVAALVVLGAATVAHADEPSSEPLFDDLTCEDIKAMIADANTAMSEYVPPPPPPECAAVCVASRLAACATTPKACAGEMMMIFLADAEVPCVCSEIDATPGDGAPR